MEQLPTPPNLPDPFPLDQAKLQLRVDHDDEDILITALTAAAIRHCENYTKRALTRQRWRVPFKASKSRTTQRFYDTPETVYFDWPFDLPKPPFVSLDAAVATYSDGTTQVVDKSLFLIEQGEPASVMLMPGAQIEIDVAGFKFDITCGTLELPEAAKQAVQMLLAHWYENRSAATMAQSDLREPPFGVTALLDPLRIVNL